MQSLWLIATSLPSLTKQRNSMPRLRLCHLFRVRKYASTLKSGICWWKGVSRSWTIKTEDFRAVNTLSGSTNCSMLSTQEASRGALQFSLMKAPCEVSFLMKLLIFSLRMAASSTNFCLSTFLGWCYLDSSSSSSLPLWSSKSGSYSGWNTPSSRRYSQIVGLRGIVTDLKQYFWKWGCHKWYCVKMALCL